MVDARAAADGKMFEPGGAPRPGHPGRDETYRARVPSTARRERVYEGAQVGVFFYLSIKDYT